MIETAPAPYARRWWALGVLCLSLLLIMLDNTIVNVALPTMVRELHASNSELQWIVDAYVLVFAGLLLTAGSLGDRFGRKGLFNLGLVCFAASAALASTATSARELIAIRALMGGSGALIMPSTLSLLTNIFPEEERARAIGIWAGIAGLGIAIGPVTGGWLLQHFWWGSVFLINVPIVIVALVAGQLLLPTSRDPRAPRIDVVGALLSIAALAVLLYTIIDAPRSGWGSGTTLLRFAMSAVLLAAFGWWEQHTSQPMLDLRFFRNRRFTAANAAVTLVFFALFGSLFSLTQYLQFVLGYSPLSAGIHLLPLAATMVIAAPSSARLAERFGGKVVVATGMLLVAVGLGMMSRTTVDNGYPHLVLSLVIMSAGMGLAMAPATEAIMGAIPRAKAGVGSAMNDTTRQLGGALGVAILGSLMSSSYRSHLSGTLAALPPEPAAAARESVGAAYAVAQQIGGPAGAALAEGARTAFVHAMDAGMLVGALVALGGAAVALLFLPARGVVMGEHFEEHEPERPVVLRLGG